MATDVTVKGTRVLIVDDASAVRSLLHNVLDAEGYTIVGQLASWPVARRCWTPSSKPAPMCRWS